MADTFEQVNDLFRRLTSMKFPRPSCVVAPRCSPPACWNRRLREEPRPRSLTLKRNRGPPMSQAGVADFDEFQGVSSWSACVTAARLLQAVADARREGTSERTGTWRGLRRLRVLQNLPVPGHPQPPNFPQSKPRPRWQRQLVISRYWGVLNGGFGRLQGCRLSEYRPPESARTARNSQTICQVLSSACRSRRGRCSSWIWQPRFTPSPSP